MTSMPNPRDEEDDLAVPLEELHQLSLFPDFSALDEEVVMTCNLEDVEYCEACQ